MTTVIKNFLMDTSSYTRVILTQFLSRLENLIARKNPSQKNEENDQDIFQIKDLPQLVLEVIVLS